MAAIAFHIFITMLSTVYLDSNPRDSSSNIQVVEIQVPPPAQVLIESPDSCLCRVAKGFIGVREATGRNDGPLIEKWLKMVGRYKGDAWCVAYVYAIHDSCGLYFPKTGYSPNVFNTPETFYKRNKKGNINDIRAGDTGGLFFPDMGRIAHTFLIVGETPKYFITNEGNTGITNTGTGTREGEGVMQKYRLRGTVAAAARYNQPKKQSYEQR